MARMFGRRVVAALIPEYFETQTALQHATGFAFSTINDWANGKSDPRIEQLVRIAEVLRDKHNVAVDPVDLLHGRVGRASEAARFRNLPWWEDVVHRARELFPKVRPYAFEWLGSLMGETPPPPDPVVIGMMANAWDQQASDAERSAAIITAAQREMDAEDRAHAKRTRLGARAPEGGAPATRLRKPRPNR